MGLERGALTCDGMLVGLDSGNVSYRVDDKSILLGKLTPAELAIIRDSLRDVSHREGDNWVVELQVAGAGNELLHKKFSKSDGCNIS